MKLRRVTALVFVCLVLSFCLLQAFFACHDCCGAHCPVCQLLRAAASFCCALTLFHFSAPHRTARLCRTIQFRAVQTPVFLSVRLNN